MKKHVKIFMEANGYKPGDFIPCSRCGHGSVDVHHIDPKGIGGSKNKDVPENLEACCRLLHDWYHGWGLKPCRELYSKEGR
jgi:hypothetical protein